MHILFIALTALLLFATPVVAGTLADANAAYKAKDYEKAFQLYGAFAEQGLARAQTNLGLMYDNGEGVPENDAKALQWYRKAAEQGHAKAQYNIAIMYDNGSGIPEDNAKAAHWYRKAAEQGHVTAQYNLGLMYYKDEGVSEDDVKAYAWWNIAAARKHKGARKNKDIIKELMTRAQIAEAQKLSSELWEKYFIPFQKD